MADADYCDLCDLPLSQCIHGMPAPPPEPPKPAAAPRVRTPRTATPRATSAAKGPSAPRRWTQPHELAPHIVAVLHDAGGRLEADDVFAALEERVELRAGDRDPNPQGELRWRAAARKARKELIDSGVLAAAGPGVWQLA